MKENRTAMITRVDAGTSAVNEGIQKLRGVALEYRDSYLAHRANDILIAMIDVLSYRDRLIEAYDSDQKEKEMMQAEVEDIKMIREQIENDTRSALERMEDVYGSEPCPHGNKESICNFCRQDKLTAVEYEENI